MVTLGVPYQPIDIENVNEQMNAQAESIVKNLFEDPDIKSSFEQQALDEGSEFVPLKDREIIALIAYLQRLGTDIKLVDVKEKLSIKE